MHLRRPLISTMTCLALIRFLANKRLKNSMKVVYWIAMLFALSFVFRVVTLLGYKLHVGAAISRPEWIVASVIGSVALFAAITLYRKRRIFGIGVNAK